MFVASFPITIEMQFALAMQREGETQRKEIATTATTKNSLMDPLMK